MAYKKAVEERVSGADYDVQLTSLLSHAALERTIAPCSVSSIQPSRSASPCASC